MFLRSRMENKNCQINLKYSWTGSSIFNILSSKLQSQGTMMQRVRPVHFDTGFSKLAQKGRGTAQVTEPLWEKPQVRSPWCRSQSTLSPCLLSPGTLLQPHWPLWWYSNLPRTSLLRAFAPALLTFLLRILASCLPLSEMSPPQKGLWLHCLKQHALSLPVI